MLSLRTFTPERQSASGEVLEQAKVLAFLKKYLRLTHCDLFFSDAAILVEGAAEKLLLPAMIKKSAPELQSIYITILEVGGAYSNRFAGLLEFLGIPYLIITDVDSVDPANKRKACRADSADAVTSNASIVFFLNRNTIDDLAGLSLDDVSVAADRGFIAFQRSTPTPSFGDEEQMYGRTLEETFVYQNIVSFKDGDLSCGIDIPETAEDVRQSIYDLVRSDTFKKTDFSLDMASSGIEWTTPKYISDGLIWLKDQLAVPQNEEEAA